MTEKSNLINNLQSHNTFKNLEFLEFFLKKRNLF